MRPLREQTASSEQLAEWRRLRLLRAGFSKSLASVVAEDERYDVHELLALRDRGCDPALAVRILAPLDQENGTC